MCHLSIYKLKKFAKWQLKYQIKDRQLLEAIREINVAPKKDCIGKFLYKKRICIENSGKSGGHRVVVAVKIEKTYFFMYGFQKNEQDNLDDKELKIFKELAKDYTSYTKKQLSLALNNQELETLEEIKP